MTYPWPYRLKRPIDLVLVVPLSVVAIPLLIGCAIAVRVSSPGPVLFRQTRIGLGGQPFTLLKFRSMVADNDDSFHREIIQRELDHPNDPSSSLALHGADPRITAVGRFLRRTSLDELPQLINVVRGEMSLVGPRPLIDWEHEMIGAPGDMRCAVPPGITGLFQIEGRKEMTTPQMLDVDRRYVETVSLGVDLKILLRTPGVLVSGRGAM